MEYNYDITIITVVFNGEDVLEHTLSSIIKQKRSSIEYIVIDGASTDNTIEIIKQKSSQINQWISEPDNGIFDAMNKGIRMAKGQWVIFINAGDQLVDKCLDQIPFEKYKTTGILYGNTIRGHYRRTFPYNLSMIETGNLPICHQSTFYNRSVLGNEMYYNSDYRLFAENELFMRVYKAGISCEYVEVDVAFFLGGGVSSSVSNETRKAKYKFLYRYYGLEGVVKAIALKARLLTKEKYQLRTDEPYHNEGAIIE